MTRHTRHKRLRHNHHTRRRHNRTPRKITKLSRAVIHLNTKPNISLLSKFFQEEPKGSYSPTINQDLITLRSIPREEIKSCNDEQVFLLKSPLKIEVPGLLYGKRCHEYDTPIAKRILLKNLSANKHVDIKKVVPPQQSLGNCWFNTMFVAFFISDKGRKFFHYFRYLMIEGKQSNGSIIPKDIRDVFAILNFAIDAVLLGNRYAYELNTNNIIRKLYQLIPKQYHHTYIVNVNEASNPIKYYINIMNYLDSIDTFHQYPSKQPINLLFVENTNTQWKETTVRRYNRSAASRPNIIVLEIFDEESRKTTNKPKEFHIGSHTYSLDSCIIRDISQQHFCALITCEGQEIAYDGMSIHKLVPMDWKKHINSEFNWEFMGSTDLHGKPFKWDFLRGYQMLVYYLHK